MRHCRGHAINFFLFIIHGFIWFTATLVGSECGMVGGQILHVKSATF